MDFIRLLLPPVLGFGIGYVHTVIAIVMLFRPFDEVRILGLRFQGMIPRRKRELARAISRVVASDLLKGERVAQRVGGEDVRRALETLTLDLVRRYGDREYGSLLTLIGPERAEVVTRALDAVLVETAQTVGRWAASPPGVATIVSVIETVLDRTPADLLPGEEVSIRQSVLGKAMEGLASPDLEDRVKSVIGKMAIQVAALHRPLSELAPEELRDVVIRTVRESVPALLRRFEEALLAPQNVEKIKGAVRSGIRSYLAETEGGVVKNVIRQLALLGRDRIFREVDDVVDANLFRLGELVYEAENRAHLEGGVTEAVDRLLALTPGEVLSRLPSEALERFWDQAARWICDQARRPAAAEALGHAFERELGRWFRTPLRGLAELSGAGGGGVQRWAEGIGSWAAGGGLEALVRRESRAVAEALLTVPLGRPARFGPPELLPELFRLGFDHLMPVVSSKVPEILRIVDVEGLIEKEVLFLSPRDVERVILTVAKRELGVIAWWGAILGALVGVVQSALTALRW